ncbi:hypothetical protein Tco_0321374 [Tanacetum coccineum]
MNEFITNQSHKVPDHRLDKAALLLDTRDVTHSSLDWSHMIDCVNWIIPLLEHWNNETGVGLGKFWLLLLIETVGKGVDEIDKLAELTDEMQLKQEDQGCVHASNELQLHAVHVDEM